MEGAAQFALVNRLHALCRDVPRSYPVCLTAGELLVLLESISQTVGPAKAAGEVIASATSKPAGAAGRRGNGEPRRLIEAFLAEANIPQRICDISEATGLRNNTISNVLAQGGFERDAEDRFRWRLRTTAPIPLSPQS